MAHRRRLHRLTRLLGKLIREMSETEANSQLIIIFTRLLVIIWATQAIAHGIAPAVHRATMTGIRRTISRTVLFLADVRFRFWFCRDACFAICRREQAWACLNAYALIAKHCQRLLRFH